MAAKSYKEYLLFMKNALKRYKDTGMLFPSSHRTAEKVVSLLPVGEMSKILEVGSGTGRFTQVIYNRISPETQLFCIEKNKAFCTYLKEILPFANVVILNEQFENLANCHNDLGCLEMDCIILTLPVALVPEALRQKWIDLAYSILKNDGYLLIHQFMPVMNNHLKNPHWRKLKRRWVYSIPPYIFEVYKKSAPQE
jgi:phospholipid N-methyltransferase